MVAKEASIKDVVETEPHRLEVPFFQRKYVWDEENWSELLQAVENFNNEKPFWGSIIIKRAEKQAGEKFSRGYIIDGQQRLTTIAILTKAIYDSTDKNERRECFDTILSCDLFFKPYSSAKLDECEIIIEHSRTDRKDFEYIIRTGAFDDSEVNIDTEKVNVEERKGSAILRCYLYYRRIMQKKTQGELKALMDNLYNDEKVFVLITLDAGDINEQIIFDSINRAGQKLTTSDIIKNNLFKRMMSQTDNKDLVCSYCDTYWDNIFWVDEFWYQNRQFGNTERSHIDFLLYCAACNLWPEDDTLEKGINCSLEQVYEKNTSGYSFDRIFNVIKKVAEYALIYKKYIYDFSENIDEQSFCKEEEVCLLLLIMDKFKIQMFYPAVLKLLSDSIKTLRLEDKVAECNLKKCESVTEAHRLATYIVRRKLAGASTSQYSKKCLEVIRNGTSALYADSGKNVKSDLIQNEERAIREELQHPKADVAKMVLFCLELEKWDEKDDINSFRYCFQLEHIMPKQWEEHWPLTKGNSSPDERNEAIKSIGNMLLLSQALNTHIRNREFKVKVEGDNTGKKKREGYKDKTQLKTTKEIIDAYDSGKTEWTEAEISERTDRIYKDVLAHWSVKDIVNGGGISAAD